MYMYIELRNWKLQINDQINDLKQVINEEIQQLTTTVRNSKLNAHVVTLVIMLVLRYSLHFNTTVSVLFEAWTNLK